MDVSARIIVGDCRCMPELHDGGADLVVTSPPYWHIKDYGAPGQIGYGQSLHQYLRDLYAVWRECYRVLTPGRRMCINIGDQFARAEVYGRYRVIPLHAEFISQCEGIGFDYMGAVIWQKKTTMNPSGGANVMGSYPYPPNGVLEIDYEFILIFRKPGRGRRPPGDVKEASRLSKDEWKSYFQGHWRFGGARQVGHEAMFPEELPKRLIKMYSFRGDTVLDPFLGSGTTALAALDLERSAVGYEVNPAFLPVIEKKLAGLNFRVERREGCISPEPVDYTPTIADARPRQSRRRSEVALHRVKAVLDEVTLELDSGELVRLLGVRVLRRDDALDYLRRYVLGREVYTRRDDRVPPPYAYLYLKNRIFVNAYMIKSGMATAALDMEYRLRQRFIDYSRSP